MSQTSGAQPTAGAEPLQPSAPYQTSAWPGWGGRIKVAPEDFQVAELPLYDPLGTGEHLYVKLWKRGLSTRAAVQRISAQTGVSTRDIGWAGQKDAQAITTQWLSLHVPAAALVSEDTTFARSVESALRGLDGPELRILEVTRHANKLRRGHLRGNRFSLRIQGATLLDGWEAPLNECIHHGFPNFFGPQRFGPGGGNASAGRRILARSRGARRLRDIDRFQIHAYQAALFNGILAHRLAHCGGLSRLLPGDLALLHRNGATFPVNADSIAEAQLRADTDELSPSAPLFGYRVPLAAGIPGEWEQAALDAEALTLDAFRLGSKDASITGERRAVRAFPRDVRCVAEAGEGGTMDIHLEFTLEPGTYATALLRELMKTSELDPGGASAESPEDA